MLKPGLFARALFAGVLVLTAAACTPKSIPVPTSGGECSELAYEGFPRLEPPMRSSFFVCHKSFALQYAVPVRSALWVVQNVKATDLDEPTVNRDRENFRPDGYLPEGVTPTPDRFTRTGYDRGHLAPAADFVEDPVGMSRSFYTSNIVPQDPGNNRGIWVRLEKNVRAWARQKGEVYVVTGPIYYAGAKPFTPQGWLSLTDGKTQYIIEEYQRDDETAKERRERKKRRGANAIAVPSHLYKVIYDPSANTAIAFVVPNVDVPSEALPQYATTVAEVERLTHLRFFPNLPMEEQGPLKTQVNPHAWLLSQ